VGICQVNNFKKLKSQYEMLKLTFNAQGSRVIIVPSCTGRSSENICSSTGGGGQEGKKERQHETEFTTKIAGKTGLVPVTSFCTNFDSE
jgi:hypothetical protein